MRQTKDFSILWRNERLYSCRKFCERHSLTRYTLHKWEALGLLHPLRVAEKKYYRDDDLLKIFDEQKK